MGFNGEVQVVQYRLFASEIGEINLLEVDPAIACGGRSRRNRLLHRRLCGQNPFDAIGASDSPRKKDYHENGDHHREEYLRYIGDKGDKVSNRHLSVTYKVAPKPDNRHGRQVQNRH